MIESIFQTFFLLATFDTILISVSIANYAISASYLGRETRLTRARMRKRKQKLDTRIKELQAKGLLIGDLKRETKQAEDDIKSLSNRLFFLSWTGAVLLPFLCFIGSFLIAVFGMNTGIIPNLPANFQDDFIRNSVISSSACLGLGFLFLLVVVGVIDSAARRIPVPEFGVTFGNYESKIELKCNEKKSIMLNVENVGEDVAEDAQVFVEFPNVFQIEKQSFYNVHPADFRYFPDCIEVEHTIDLVHVGVSIRMPIFVTAPNLKKTYEISIIIRERKSGVSKHRLEIEVVD